MMLPCQFVKFRSSLLLWRGVHDLADQVLQQKRRNYRRDTGNVVYQDRGVNLDEFTGVFLGERTFDDAEELGNGEAPLIGVTKVSEDRGAAAAAEGVDLGQNDAKRRRRRTSSS